MVRVRRAVLLAVFAAACRPHFPDESPFVQQRHQPSSIRPTIDSVGTARPRGLCQVTLPDLNAAAGPGAVSCSNNACANAAFRNRRPFVLCSGGWGMDSWMESGIAGLPNGDLMVITFDGFGAYYRGICPRGEVSLDPAGWPDCRRELVDRTDVRTGKPYVALEDRYGEPWPPPCAAAARIAKRVPFPPRVLEKHPLVTDPRKWKLRCSRFGVTFDLLIDRSGAVRCARLQEDVGRWPAGLADEIRKNLKSWRFVRPTLDGEPLEVRWAMREWNVCGDGLR